MPNVEKLRKRPQHFLRFTGLTVSQFDGLLGQMRQTYPAFNAQCLVRPDRQRRVGGGSTFRLSLPDRTLLALVFLRLYLTNDLLAYLFGMDASNISRNLRALLPLLEQQLPVPAQPHVINGFMAITAKLTPTQYKQAQKLNLFNGRRTRSNAHNTSLDEGGKMMPELYIRAVTAISNNRRRVNMTAMHTVVNTS